MSAPPIPIPNITGGASGTGPQTLQGWSTGGVSVVKSGGWVWALVALVALVLWLRARKKK